MALPKFNDTPIYEMIVPSTQKKVKFRPFLVKEQKILLIAMESQDEGQILESILNTISSCVQGDFKVSDLSVFDIEYMFMRLRAKSVGEKAELNIQCPDCEEGCDASVNLEDIEISNLKEELPKIKVNDQYTIQLKYPKFNYVLNEMKNTKDTSISNQMSILSRAVLDCLLSEEERISFEDETPEDIEEFVDSLPTEVFGEILSFAQDLPTVTKSIEYHCDACNKDHVRELSGMIDFFQYASPTTI